MPLIVGLMAKKSRITVKVGASCILVLHASSGFARDWQHPLNACDESREIPAKRFNNSSEFEPMS